MTSHLRRVVTALLVAATLTVASSSPVAAWDCTRSAASGQWNVTAVQPRSDTSVIFEGVRADVRMNKHANVVQNDSIIQLTVTHHWESTLGYQYLSYAWMQLLRTTGGSWTGRVKASDRYGNNPVSATFSVNDSIVNGVYREMQIAFNSAGTINFRFDGNLVFQAPQPVNWIDNGASNIQIDTVIQNRASAMWGFDNYRWHGRHLEYQSNYSGGVWYPWTVASYELNDNSSWFYSNLQTHETYGRRLSVYDKNCEG